MLCNVCNQKEAKVHLTQMLEGKIQKVDLCEACARDKGVDDPTGFSLADLLMGLGAAQELDPSPQGDSPSVCDSCGYTQADFKKTGRLGCPDCYDTFAEGLSQMIRAMHKGTRHTGKVPRHLRNARELEAKAHQLEQDLRKAVEEERYEDAAVLRDSIKSIQNELNQVASDRPADA